MLMSLRAWIARGSRFSLLLGLGLVAGCFSPDLGPAPFLCATGPDPCPDGYVCANQVCIKPGSILIDAGGLPDIVLPDTPTGGDVPIGGPDVPGACGETDYACKSCAAAQMLPMPPDMPTGAVITLTGTTSGTGGFAGSCSTMMGAEAESPEVVYILVLPFKARVDADTQGSSFDTLLYLRSSCSVGAGDLKCSDDISTDPSNPVTQSAFTVDLDIGTYYLFVDGFNRAEMGNYKLNVKVTPL
jgi:hypothetical protein